VFSIGDNTFGKTSVIDKNTRQFAFFSEIIASGSDLLSMPERSNVYIKYLIDATGSLTDLTKRNYDILTEDQKYNLYQVQNIFKNGETVNIGLFDNQNPTKQQLLDGNKSIFTGGFKFYPVLWNRTGGTSFVYNLVTPKLINITNPVGGTPPSPQNFIATAELYNVAPPTAPPLYDIKVDVTSIIGPLVQSVNVTVRVIFNSPTYGINGSETTIVPIGAGQVTGTSYIYLHVNDLHITSVVITRVTLQSGGGSGTGGTSNYTNLISSSIDPEPFFKLHVSQSNVLIASQVMSLYYAGAVSGSYVSPGFYFNGNDGGFPTYNESDYIFKLNPGDLIRLYNTGISSSIAGFSPLYEYEITDITTPFTPFISMSITLSKNIDLGLIQSFTANQLTGSITKYIISRKIPDETNIVIEYQKRPGQTSAGIIRNANLAPDVNIKIADIVSDLKSKIFSTVLIP
jgi:hypothetical protein